MLIKQDGKPPKTASTQIYMRCIYNMYTCTYILDVSKRGVLDRRMTILCIFSAYSVNFSGYFFVLIRSMFFCEYLHIINNGYTWLYDIACFLHIMTLFIVHGKVGSQFTCKFCIFAAHGRHGTVENASRILEF